MSEEDLNPARHRQTDRPLALPPIESAGMATTFVEHGRRTGLPRPTSGASDNEPVCSFTPLPPHTPYSHPHSPTDPLANLQLTDPHGSPLLQQPLPPGTMMLTKADLERLKAYAEPPSTVVLDKQSERDMLHAKSKADVAGWANTIQVRQLRPLSKHQATDLTPPLMASRIL